MLCYFTDKVPSLNSLNAVVKSNAVGTFFPKKIFKNFRIVKCWADIWNQHEKCIKMNTNMPMFGPVALEIA